MNLLAGRDKQPLLHWAAEEVERSKSLSAHSHHPGVTWHVIGFKNIDNRSLVDSNTSGNVWPTQWLTSTSFSSIYQPLDALGGLDALKQRNPTWWACSSKGQPVNVKLLNWTGRAWALSILKTLFCKLAVLKNLQTCTFFFFGGLFIGVRVGSFFGWKNVEKNVHHLNLTHHVFCVAPFVVGSISWVLWSLPRVPKLSHLQRHYL